MTLRIRDARPSDADALHANCLRLAWESEGKRPEAAAARAAIEAAIRDPTKARYFIAEQDGDVIGSCFITREWSDWNNGWYWWLQGVYVESTQRRQGVYSKLYEAIRTAAREDGDVHSIRLYVHEGNPARAAYEAHGMAEQPYRIYDAPVDN